MTFQAAEVPALIRSSYNQFFDRLILTVWSTPNYCYRCGTVGGILELDDNLRQEHKVFALPPTVGLSFGDKDLR